MTGEAKAPANVVEALARVQSELPGIGKDSKASDQQGGYSYRGIESITRETQKLLGKYGVVFVPEVLTWETVDITVNGKPWTDTKLRVQYRVYGPGGLEDSIVVGPMCAIGRDNTDKGANKAMTQAFKYALLQTLCIGDEKDDGDKATHEADPHEEPAPNPKAAPLVDRLALLPETAQNKILDWFNTPVDAWPRLNDESLDKLAGVIAKAETAEAVPA